MSDGKPNKIKEEVRFSAPKKTIKPRRIVPQKIICEWIPDEDHPEVKEVHQFDCNKVYVVLNEQGLTLDVIAVCPLHCNPISVNAREPYRTPPQPSIR